MTAKIIIATLVVVIVGIVLFWLVKKFRRGGEFGFRDVVRNPRIWQKMVEEHAQSESKRLPNWSAKEIEKQVRQYVFTKGDEEDVLPLGNVLKALSPQTHESLMGILRDPSKHDELSELRKERYYKRSPVMRTCDLFAGNMPEEAVSLLKPFLEHKSDEIRKECILAVAQSGLGIALPSVLAALKDEEEYVRSYTLIGLKRAWEAETLSHELAVGILTELESSILAGQEIEKCAKLLSVIEPSRARDFLTSEAVLSPHTKAIHEVIRTIREFQFQVSRERVLDLYDEISKREMKYPNDYAIGELLALLGTMRNPLDETLLEEKSRHTATKVADGAATGLLSYHGLGDFKKKIWNGEASDNKPLSKEQQMYFAVYMLDAEINNGGHSQYFFNSTGDDWKNALDGLKAMGLEDRVALFQRSLDYFGSQGPSSDRKTRQTQFSKIYRKHEADFKKLDSQYYDSKESIEVGLMRFVIQNAPKFQ